MSKVRRITDGLDLWTQTYYQTVSKKQSIKEQDKREAAKDILATFREHCLPNPEDKNKFRIYNRVINFLQDEIDVKPSQASQPFGQKLTITPEKQERVNEDEEDRYYNESESPEIVNAFLDVIQNTPITPEQTYSIYSDEELDNF